MIASKKNYIGQELEVGRESDQAGPLASPVCGKEKKNVLTGGAQPSVSDLQTEGVCDPWI
jgi:hypothetical protein